MKLAIILPGEIATEAWQPLENEINRIVSPGTESTIFDIKGGKVRVPADIDLTVPAAMSIAADAEKKGLMQSSLTAPETLLCPLFGEQ